MEKRRRSWFLVTASIVILIIAGSGFFASHEIYRLTQKQKLFEIWAVLCLIFQIPLVIIPLDRGRTISFIGEVFPEWVSLLLITWNLTQIFIFFLAPLIILLPSTSSLISYFPVGLALVVCGIVFRSAFYVVEKKITIKLPSLPKGWEPLTILHLSDIHSGPFMRRAHLNRVISRINIQKKIDLCVITGDVINHSSKELGWTLSLLEKVNTSLGIFASIGNHEYIDNEKDVIQGYKNSKIELLLDSSKSISHGAHKLRLIGIDFPFGSGVTLEKDIGRALTKSFNVDPHDKDELQILLSHHPNGFKSAQALGIPLTLSGHTHGGQIRFGSVSLVAAFNEYIMGLYEANGLFLYVSAGLGNWLPFRINVPCEFALITVESSG